jgi:hypothetical protein
VNKGSQISTYVFEREVEFVDLEKYVRRASDHEDFFLLAHDQKRAKYWIRSLFLHSLKTIMSFDADLMVKFTSLRENQVRST